MRLEDANTFLAPATSTPVWIPRPSRSSSGCYVFPVGGAGGLGTQNVVVLAVDDEERRTATSILDAARAATTPSVPRLAEHAEHLHEGLDTYGAPILRDDFAAVEMLLDPVSNSAFGRG